MERGKRKASKRQAPLKKGAEVEVLATAEEDGRQIVRDSKELATACLELAKDGLSRARDAENAGDFRNYVIAACAATDKWRLLTDQSTHISETRNGDQRTDEEILEDLEDYAAIFKERAARRGAGT